MTGNDDLARKVEKELKNEGINSNLIKDESRPTTFKKRYVVENQKVFRVSKLEDKSIPVEIENKLIELIEKNAKNYVANS